MVLPQGTSFNSLVKQFSNIAKKETSGLWKYIAIATIDGRKESFHFDGANALTTLLE